LTPAFPDEFGIHQGTLVQGQRHPANLFNSVEREGAYITGNAWRNSTTQGIQAHGVRLASKTDSLNQEGESDETAKQSPSQT
jgi:hypothetical protein